jgi:hypothetical protein
VPRLRIFDECRCPAGGKGACSGIVSCAGCGNGPSCLNTWPRSRPSIPPPQAGDRTKCYLDRPLTRSRDIGRLITGCPLTRGLLVGRRLPGHRVYEVDPSTGRASYRNVGLAIVAGVVKPNLYIHSFRGTSIDYRSHEPGHSWQPDCTGINPHTSYELRPIALTKLAAPIAKIARMRGG